MTINEYLFGNGGSSELDRRARTSTFWEAVKDFVDDQGEDKVADLTQDDKDYLFSIKEQLQKSYR